MTDLQKQLIYWKETSERDLKTAKGLFKLKRYDACLFFCHLSLEKLLKGFVVAKTQEPAPYIHDLERLLKLSNINDATKQTISDLKTITEFNISGRYPEIKAEFYKKCNKDYTKKHLALTNKLYLWLKKKYPKN
jgi:HEPN domain-containing protein